MIPRIIHYCWFGRGPKPELFTHCYNSWKRYCRNFKIIEWNEDNYDISTAPLFVQQAYEAGKWAFVTDYVRLDVVYRSGGIYLDTDVEVIRSLRHLLKNKVFFGLERDEFAATGLGFGAEKGAEILLEMMEDYRDIPFILPDGEYDLTTCPMRNTDVLLRHGFKRDGSEQLLDGMIHIYPKEVLCPWNDMTGTVDITEKTVTIHWYSGSWLLEEEQPDRAGYRDFLLRKKRKDSIIEVFGEGGYLFAQKFWNAVKRLWTD